MISTAVEISEIHILRFVNVLTVSRSEERLSENCSLAFPTCEHILSVAGLSCRRQRTSRGNALSACKANGKRRRHGRGYEKPRSALLDRVHEQYPKPCRRSCIERDHIPINAQGGENHSPPLYYCCLLFVFAFFFFLETTIITITITTMSMMSSHIKMHSPSGCGQK